MTKTRSVVWIAAALLASGVALAGDVGLTSVLYPEGKGVDVPMAGTQRAPAATLTAKVKHQSGQSSITIQYKDLQPAILFGGDIVSYVVWAVGPDGTFENVGGIANDDSPKPGNPRARRRSTPPSGRSRWPARR
jgi:hypothetical protein